MITRDRNRELTWIVSAANADLTRRDHWCIRIMRPRNMACSDKCRSSEDMFFLVVKKNVGTECLYNGSL